MNLDELKAAADEAKVVLDRARSRVTKEAREAAGRAADAVRDKHADELAALVIDETDKRMTYEAAVSAAASHPWEGKRVFKVVSTGFRATKRVIGIVMIRRTGDYPGASNQSYGLPFIGEAYIVKLKADGTPGARVEHVIRNDLMDDWKLEEEAVA